MGLDMYLYKRIYVGNKYNKPEEIIKTVYPDNREKTIKDERISEIIEEIGYWRKANQIHNWFVTNVQNGVDDCKEYYVDSDDLEKLLDVVNEVLQDHTKAIELLPPASGFFFGRTEIDDYYFEVLENTKKIIESALKEEDGDIYYDSSW